MNLHQAAQEGNLNALLQLIHEGADINAADRTGSTPLHCAAENGHTPIAAALIQADANVNATDDIRWTPVYNAVEHGHKQIALALIQAGANVNAADILGYTPMHWAVVRTHTEIVLALIQAGANVHAANRDGQTPLSLAISRNELATALAIIHYGKVPYAEIPVIENNPTSEYIQRQYQLATTPLERTDSYARGFFTDMNISLRNTSMARIKIFVTGTGAKGTYPLLMKLLYNGKGISADLMSVILEHAGLLPQNMNLNTLMIYPRPSRRLLSAEATSCNAPHASATSVTAPSCKIL